MVAFVSWGVVRGALVHREGEAKEERSGCRGVRGEVRYEAWPADESSGDGVRVSFVGMLRLTVQGVCAGIH